jgi:hypothetical protein
MKMFLIVKINNKKCDQLFSFTFKGMCVPFMIPQICYKTMMSQKYSMMFNNHFLEWMWTKTRKQLVTIKQNIIHNVSIFALIVNVPTPYNAFICLRDKSCVNQYKSFWQSS